MPALNTAQQVHTIHMHITTIYTCQCSWINWKPGHVRGMHLNDSVRGTVPPAVFIWTFL